MPSYRLAPDAILVQTNLVGLVTVIQDDPDTPDALWLTASSTSTPSDLRVSFPTPTEGTPSGAQECRFRVRKVGGVNTPVATVEVYDGSTLIASATANVTTSQVISLPWTGTGDGTQIEARVFSDTQGGKASSKSTIEVGAVEWNAATVVLESKSGTGSISQTHALTGVGINQASGSGTISQTNAITGSGVKQESASNDKAGAGSISQVHSTIGSGFKSIAASGVITHTPTSVGTGAKATQGFAAISAESLATASGIKAVAGNGSISQSHSVTGAGGSGGGSSGIVRKASFVVGRGTTLVVPPLVYPL